MSSHDSVFLYAAGSVRNRFRLSGIGSLILMLAMAFSFTACGGTKLVLPQLQTQPAQVVGVLSATLQEYCDGEPISRAFLMEGQFDLFNIIVCLENQQFTKTSQQSVDDVPSAEKSYRINLELADGNTRTLYFYAKEDKQYIEEPYAGIYVGNPPDWCAPYWDAFTQKDYLMLSLVAAFGSEHYPHIEKVPQQERYPLLPAYNGAGKAVRVDIYDNHDETVRHPPFDDPLWKIPENRLAERAEDVRYVVEVSHVTGSIKGYWVDENGKTVGTERDNSSYTTIYDLVTGSITKIDDGNGLDAFFANVD